MYVSLLNIGAHIQQLASQQPHDEPFINDQQFRSKLCSSLEVPNNPTNRHRLKKAYINRLTAIRQESSEGEWMPERSEGTSRGPESPSQDDTNNADNNNHDSGEDGQEMPESPPEGLNLPEEDNDHDSGEGGQEMPQSPQKCSTCQKRAM
ncbi:hypothetical protein WMY93_018381 [Mugilogobius chulae]|uniref:LEM domain-containing protein n=1 Tax=Mugilogobius chulae TaxID=88201 RepID=A0AAW0NUN1_9GOBI